MKRKVQGVKGRLNNEEKRVGCQREGQRKKEKGLKVKVRDSEGENSGPEKKDNGKDLKGR